MRAGGGGFLGGGGTGGPFGPVVPVGIAVPPGGVVPPGPVVPVGAVPIGTGGEAEIGGDAAARAIGEQAAPSATGRHRPLRHRPRIRRRAVTAQA
jgi:hypothetical protein